MNVIEEHNLKLTALARPIASEADAAAKLEIALGQLQAASGGDYYGDEPEMLRQVANELEALWRRQEAA